MTVITCHACGSSLPEKALFCPECGSRQAEEPGLFSSSTLGGSEASLVGALSETAEPGGGSRRETTGASHRAAAAVGSSGTPGLLPIQSPPTHIRSSPSRGDLNALLARANLLRMRGQWGEAVERCTEALRLDAHCAAAHSLLGDIYENQGRLDKAIHWYELALEQNPDSVADKAKLTRARELQAVRRRTRAPRLSWSYLVAVAGVAFLFVAFVMAAWVAPERRTISTVVNDVPLPAYPSAMIPKENPPDHTTEEDELRKSLRDDLHSFMYVTATYLDPVESEATVTVRIDDRAIIPDPVGGVRGRILREGYRIAYLARQYLRTHQQELRFVKIRALSRLSGGGNPTAILWQGRVDVTRLGVSDDQATAAEVRDVYPRDPKKMFWNTVAGF